MVADVLRAAVHSENLAGQGVEQGGCDGCVPPPIIYAPKSLTVTHQTDGSPKV